MLFAHLIPHSTDNAARTILVPAVPGNDVALLRARTLLAYMDANDLLQRTDAGDWVLFAPASHDTAAFGDPVGDYLASVPYLPRTPIRLQPGLALVRNTFEAITLFRSVYLRSSIDFLRKNPTIERDLFDHLLVPSV